LDATERHEGLVAAIAFESLVKLLAFIAVGLFVTFWLYDGFGDIFGRAGQTPQLSALLTLGGESGGYATWASLTFLSMAAIMFLPRQFQVTVVENVDERHLTKAIWLFRSTCSRSIFSCCRSPSRAAALSGRHSGRGHVRTDAADRGEAAVARPLRLHRGLSAATGMVIVETIALSTMVCNDLVMPVLLRLKALRLTERRDLSGLLLGIRRGAATPNCPHPGAGAISISIWPGKPMRWFPLG